MTKFVSRLLKETCYFTRLENGLPVFFVPKKGIHKKAALFAVHYGSIDIDFIPSGGEREVKTPPGVAHFLEHLLFKKGDIDLMSEFARYGGYYNAATGNTATVYFFTATGYWNENLELLQRLVFTPYFSPENVAKERLVIEQEIKMYRDIPEIRIMNNLLNNLYHEHPIRFDIGGTVESIKEITPKQLEFCYQTFYHPQNVVGIFIGDIDFSALVGQLNRYFEVATKSREGKGKPAEDGLKTQRGIVTEPVFVRNQQTVVEMAVARPRLLLGYKERHIGRTGEALFHQTIATDLALDCILGKGSELYNRLYNEGLIDDDFSAAYELHPTFGQTIIGGETDKPDLLYEQLTRGINKARKQGIKRRDLYRLKRKYLGRFIRLFDDPQHIGIVLSHYYFNNLEVFQTPHYLNKVLWRDVTARLREHLDPEYHAVSVVKPR